MDNQVKGARQETSVRIAFAKFKKKVEDEKEGVKEMSELRMITKLDSRRYHDAEMYQSGAEDFANWVIKELEAEMK